MDPSDYVRALRKRWTVILVLAALGTSAGLAVSASTTPVYRATSKIFVSLQGGDTVSELVQGSTYTQNLVQSYVALATMPVVLDPVIDELDLDVTARTLARSITAETPLNTVIVEISATSSAPGQAADIADAVAAELADAVEDLSTTGGRSESVSMRTVAPADVPTAPIAPNTRLLAATGLLLGLALGVAFALVRELLDTKVRDTKDVARVTDAAVLGSIGSRHRARSGTPVMLAEPHSPTAEAYRRLRTNLKFLDFAGPLHSVVVTSPLPADGKSTTAINLALALAEGPSRVLLVDADLRRPSVAGYTGMEGAVGLTTVLIGGADLHEVTQPYGEGLDILPAGAVPPNPTQLLSSPAMVEVLALMEASYDIVILDSPPLLPVTDSAILTRLADGALVVAAARKTRRHQLAEAIDSLNAVGAVCLGVVLNRVVQRDSDAYYGYAPEPDTIRRPRGDRAGGRRRRRGRPSGEPTTEADPEQGVGTTPAADGALRPDQHGTTARADTPAPQDGTATRGPKRGTSHGPAPETVARRR